MTTGMDKATLEKAGSYYEVDQILKLRDPRFVPMLKEVRSDFAAGTGFVHQVITDDFEGLSDFDIHACGASAMIGALNHEREAEHSFDPMRLIADSFLAETISGDVGPSADSQRVELFVDHRAVEGSDGEALVFALKRAGAPLQAVCGGKGACGTCIIHVPSEWRNRTGEPSKREARLLQYLGAGEGDRLSCQIRLGADLNGLKVEICTNQTKGDEQ